MNPGRELDALIAEKVMGWTAIELKPENGTGVMVAFGIRPGERPSTFTGYRPSYRVPSYSTDIAAAWQVVENLSRRGFMFKMEVIGGEYECDGLNFWAGFLIGREIAFSKGHTSRSAPHAICLESLKACGVEI